MLLNENIVILLLDHRNREIGFVTNPSGSPENSVEPVSRDIPNQIESTPGNNSSPPTIWESIANLGDDLISATCVPYENGSNELHVLSLSRTVPEISIVRISRRKITGDFRNESYEFLEEKSFDASSEDPDRLIFRFNANIECTHIYRVVATSPSNIGSYTKDIYVAGTLPIKPKFSVTCYQILNSIQFRFHNIPIIAKRIRITERSFRYQTSRTVFDSIISSCLSDTLFN